MGNPENNYQSHCIKCGFCCEPFFMDDELIEKFRCNFQRLVIHEEHIPELEQTMIHTMDSMCVFLYPDNTCSIYEDRPEMCKRFGDPEFCECPRISADGKMRSNKEFERINAINTDPRKWSLKHKKQLQEMGMKRARYLVNKKK